MSLRAPFPGQRRLMLLIVLVGAAFVLFFPTRQLVQQRRHIGDLEQRLSKLHVANARLDEDVKRLTDPAELEVLARERLGLVRPGERAYFVDPVKPKPTPIPRAPERAPWWERSWESLISLLRGRD
jgi:cell division protein FtsB